jgi:hypothetical protein
MERIWGSDASVSKTDDCINGDVHFDRKLDVRDAPFDACDTTKPLSQAGAYQSVTNHDARITRPDPFIVIRNAINTSDDARD